MENKIICLVFRLETKLSHDNAKLIKPSTYYILTISQLNKIILNWTIYIKVKKAAESIYHLKSTYEHSLNNAMLIIIADLRPTKQIIDQ